MECFFLLYGIVIPPPKYVIVARVLSEQSDSASISSQSEY